MSVRVVSLNAPPDVLAQEEEAAERVERLRKADLKSLSVRQTERLEKYLKKILRAAKRETGPLLRRLVRWNDLLEGIVEETNFPFEGASNITLRYAMGLARTFEASFNKTVYGDADLFYPVLDPGAQEELQLNQQQLQVLQEGFNHSFSVKYNGIDTLKGGTIPAFRDGTFLIEGSWERRIERVNDQRTYRSYDEFVKDYPNPEDAGGGEGNYQNLLDYFLVEGPTAELIVRFSHQFVTFEGIEYRSLLRAKFVNYPTTVKTLAEADIYGCYFDLQKDELKRRGKRKEFYSDGVAKAMKRTSATELDEWDRNRLYVEGLAAPDPEDAPVRAIDLVVKFDLDDDGTREQYRVKAAVRGDDVYLLACRPYDLRHNTPGVVPLRLMARDHAFDGASLVGDGEDLFNQVDTLFRHDNNVMMLTTSPIFIADKTLKEELDLGRAENIIRPGVTYWVPDIEKAVKQLPVTDIAAGSGDNNGKMALMGRFAELLIGVTQAASGNQTPDDPRAPAHKTQLLLLQANKRIDACVDEWCLSFPDIAKLQATLIYQYSAERDYTFTDRQGQQQKFPIQILSDPRLHWMPKRRSVTLTPEFAISRLQSLFQTYATMKQLLDSGDPVSVELWNRTVSNSGEPQAEKFMISSEQAQQVARANMQNAMKKAETQSLMAAKAEGQKTLAREAAKAAVTRLTEPALQDISGVAAENGAVSAGMSRQNGSPGV